MKDEQEGDMEDGGVRDDQEYLGTEHERAAEVRRLRAENEDYHQETYALRRKLELTEAAVRDLQEANDSLERSHARLLQEKRTALANADTEHRAAREEYERRVVGLEARLAEERERSKRLQDLVERQEKEAQDWSAAAVPDCQASLEDRSSLNESLQLEKLSGLLQEEQEKREQAEALLSQLRNQCDEYKIIITLNKEQLAEKAEALESAREELACVRTEMLSYKQSPANDSTKGNSLFAEVEDLRLDAMEKMSTLRSKYEEMKRMCRTKENEIRSLKSERAAMLKKWESDAVLTFTENDGMIGKYKSRIQSLEDKLKAEIRKNTDLQEKRTTDESSNYLHSLMAAKKREEQELRLKLEDLSTKFLVLEEAKLNHSKQVRYWRYKATTLEAQLLALKTDIESGTLDVNRNTLLRTISSIACEDRKTEAPDNSRRNLPTETSGKISNPVVSYSEVSARPPDMRQSLAVPQLRSTKVEKHQELPETTKERTTESTDDSSPLEGKKVVRFSEDTNASEKERKATVKQAKEREYPVVYIAP